MKLTSGIIHADKFSFILFQMALKTNQKTWQKLQMVNQEQNPWKV